MNTSPVVGGRPEAHVKEGDIFESLLDGMEYVVKNFVNSMVVLRSREENRHIITEAETLKIESFYRKKEKKVRTVKI